jgi:hypothetical protein
MINAGILTAAISARKSLCTISCAVCQKSNGRGRKTSCMSPEG